MPKKVLQLMLFLLLPIFIQLNALPMIGKSGNIVFSLIMFGVILYVLMRIIKKYKLPLIRRKFDWRALLLTIFLTVICEVISLLLNYLNQLVTKTQPDPLIMARLSNKSIWIIIVTMLTINITGPILEELTMRGIIFQYSADIFNSRIVGAIISSIVFALLHDEGIILSINYFITSILLTFIFEKTKNIYSNILSHQLLNVISTILFFL
ncbi:CPBP family intramembrane glutamic endopeptidase [Companilactobacillus sp. HBUAS56275]|uniref:CPBP family intramembrane glutamic endopeptidase n=1 Tax=Companilactobacillus sp. HBUAS56275 TaxID=3109364 RepID=UPI002FF31F58